MTKNEILSSLNKPHDFVLALVEFLDGDAHRVRYLRRPFQREPDFAGSWPGRGRGDDGCCAGDCDA